MVISSNQPFKIDTVANLQLLTANDGDSAWAQDLRLGFTYNATSGLWIPSARVVSKVSSVIVNGLTTGAVPIYTLENSGTFNFFPVMTIARVSSVVGSGTQPVITLGTNSTSYNNIVSSSLLTGIGATLGAGNGSPQNASFSPKLAGGTAIYANVTTAAIAFTTYQITYEILGTYNSY